MVQIRVASGRLQLKLGLMTFRFCNIWLALFLNIPFGLFLKELHETGHQVWLFLQQFCNLRRRTKLSIATKDCDTKKVPLLLNDIVGEGFLQLLVAHNLLGHLSQT